MEAVALFSYTASEADEISFQRGDVIKVSALNAQRGRKCMQLPKLKCELGGKVRQVYCMFVFLR